MAFTNTSQSRGYITSYRGANAPSAFYDITLSTFGEPAPATPSLTYHSGSGSLASSTAYVKVTWVTAEGVSLPSAEASVLVSASTGAVTVAQPTVPTVGATIIGWQIYSEASTTGEALNTAATSSSPSPSSLAVNGGTVTGYPVATTSVLLEVYGTGAAVPTIDGSGIQAAYPSVPANTTLDYYFVVPNSGSQWKVYKPVHYIQPDGGTQTTGVSIGYGFDCLSPVYPGATPGTATYTQASVANGTYMVLNGILFQATQAGTQNTAATFIGSAAFQNIAKGSTVTDGSVTWTSRGRAVLVRAQFENVTATAAVPEQQNVALFQF